MHRASSNAAVRRYMPDKFRRLVHVTERLNRLSDAMFSLEQDIACDIIDGWSTGDPVVDFALVACDGRYDAGVVTMQYRRLFDLGWQQPGQRILVVQQAEHSIQSLDDGEVEDGFFVLRNVYLAVLRRGNARCTIDSLTVRLPVEPGYLLWRELAHVDGDAVIFVEGHSIMTTSYLEVGPFCNQFSDFGTARIDDEGIVHVPTDAVCDVEVIPSQDPRMEELYGIDAAMLSYLHRLWIRLRSIKEHCAA